MRIMLSGVCVEGGGAEQVIQDLALGFAARGHEVVVVYIEGTDEIVPRLEQQGIDCIRLLPREKLAAHWWSDITPGSIVKMRRLLIDLKPDIVHMHVPRPSLWTALGELISGSRSPLVYTEHNVQSALNIRGVFAQHVFIPRTRYVIAVSEAVRHSFQTKWHRYAGRIKTIHNGITVDRLRANRTGEETRASLATPLATSVVCNVANITDRKGQDVLMRAIAKLDQSLVDVRCWCAGGLTHQPSAVSALKRLIEDLRIADRVSLLGARSDVPDLLEACDVFVLSSRQEGLPITILEAMAAGKPVVATDVGGCAEVVRHGETGLIVPPEDPDALAGAIQTVLTDSNLAHEMGKAGRERVEEHFTVDAMVDKHIEVYETVISE